MIGPLEIQQYDPAVEVKLSHPDLLRLRAAAGRGLTIAPTSQPDQWALRSGNLVGTIATPAVSVMIRPKVDDANLFHLLEPSTPALSFGADSFGYAAADDLMASFSAFYLRHLDLALGRGLVRSYVEHGEPLMGVRGRVEMALVARRGGLPLPVDCRFDEHSGDTHLNRVLAGAANCVARWPRVSPMTRVGLRRALGMLEEAGPLTRADLEHATVFTRLNEHFRPAERLARLALEGSSLLDSPGQTAASSFLIDMNKVFERFVEDRLRRYLSGRVEVRGQAGTQLDVGGRIRMKPDLVFRIRGRDVYVADSKYKLTATGDGREADYYQLLAYCTALENVDEGMLIYCQHDGDVPDRMATVVGPAGKRLATTAIRLDGTPAEIDARLQALADEIHSRATIVNR